MADRPDYPDPGDDTRAEPDDEATAGTPLWVKVFGAVTLIVVVLFVILLLSGRGGHGPGRHSGFDRGGGHALPPGSAHGEQQP